MAAFRVHVFGAPHVTDAAGQPVASLMAQPKRLAVLTYLVVEASGKPVMRDKVATLFWPELDQSRARQALRQSVHVIRGELGAESVVGVGAEMLALGAGVVTSDVADFEAAAADGHLAQAVGCYRGPLLDGFHVADAVEFDQWVSDARGRYQTAVARLVERLADEAEQAGRLAEAEGWHRRRLTLSDADERSLRRLMHVLRAQGNPAAALAAYDDYASWMRREFELGPSAETEALADELRRQGPVAAAWEVRPVAQYAPSLPADAGVAASPASAVPGGTRHTPTRPVLSRFGFAATIVVAVAGAALVAQRLGLGEPDPPPPSVAVLPFLDLSPGSDQRYLSDGLTEELITALAQVRGLKVPARTSSFAFRDSKSDVRTIARRLGVTAVLEGSVRIEGDRLRVTAQLINAQSGYHLWSENFDRPAADLLAVQGEIAVAIARALRVQLVGPTVAPGGDAGKRAAAHTAYLKGRFFWNQRDAEGIRTAIQMFSEAIAHDSSYAPAHAGLASAYQLAPNFAVLQPDSAFPRAVAAVRRALALDPDLAEAHASLGFIKIQWERDFPGAERALKRAIEVAPGYASAHQWLRLYHVAVGQLPEALAAARRARELDPVSISILCGLGDIFLYLGQPDSAAVQYESALALDPDFERALHGLARARLAAGDAADAIALAERAVARPNPNPRYVGGLGMIYGRAGRPRDAQRQLDAVRAIARRSFVPPYAFIVAHVGAGNRDSAQVWIERATAERDAFVIELWPYPEFRDLNRDPAFRAALTSFRGSAATR